MGKPKGAAKSLSSLWKQGREKLFEPVDIASIVVFRMCFGATMMLEVWRFFEYDWIRIYYMVRDFHFKYRGFEWVEPWPGDGMYIHFLVVGIAAFCVMTGFLYRLSSWILFIGFTWWFLLDQTRYLNHLYFTALLAFLITLIPANRAVSLDAKLRPGIRSDTVPAWCLWTLRAQIGLVYFFAGVAKIDGDWLRGAPVADWIASRSDYALIGPALEWQATVVLFSWGGMLFDLIVAPALLWRRTRWWALVACVFFHGTNKVLFDIGIFPMLMLAGTLLLLPPDWPRKLCLFLPPISPGRRRVQPSSFSLTWKNLVAGFLVLWFSLQIFLPLRHHLYPGYVAWTEEGHRFAWRMKLRQKEADARFFATDPRTGQTWEVDHTRWLSSKQSERVGRFPDMALQFAHFLAEELEKDGHEDVEIRVRSMASLNGREPQLIIDPNVDLTQEPWDFGHDTWILPLTEPLPRRD